MAIQLCDDAGRVFESPVARWFGSVTPDEDRLLDDVAGPVLDVGCGPGRHTLALARRGVVTLGIDVCDVVLATARRQRAPVLRRSVFERLPGAGRWATALLLDGNIGLGGDVGALLTRLRSVLHPRGRALVEVENRSAPATTVRFESPHAAGPWFRLARIGRTDLEAVADASGWRVLSTWIQNDRWFGWLEQAG